MLLSFKAFQKEIQEPELDHCYLLVCTESKSEGEDADFSRFPKPFVDMLESYQDVYPEELPPGLPPLRGIEHRMDFVPGAVIPNRPAY